MNDKVFEALASVWDGPATAVEMRELVGARTGRTPPLTSFYRALRTAHGQRWLEILGGEETGGRPAQRYALTAAGREAVAAEAERVRRLAALVPDVSRETAR